MIPYRSIHTYVPTTWGNPHLMSLVTTGVEVPKETRAALFSGKALHPELVVVLRITTVGTA